MLRETDNSMMAIGAGMDFLTPPVPAGTNRLPKLQAVPVQEKGMTVSPDRTAADNVPAISSGDHPCQCAQLSSTAVSAVKRLTNEQWMLLTRGLRQRFEAVSACFTELVRTTGVRRSLNAGSSAASQVQSLLGPLAGISRSQIDWTWFGSTDVYLSERGGITVLDHNFALPTGIELLATTGTDRLSSEVIRRFLKVPSKGIEGITVVLTPGSFSSAGRGNDFLAGCLNAVTARGSDLVVRNDGVYCQSGPELVRVASIVRRVDDDLLDPNCYRPNSLVGVPGLIRAWKQGLVNILSPPGISIANNRTFGRLIPGLIREYLGEEPILASCNVLDCEDTSSLKHVLDHVKDYAIRTNDPLHPLRPFFGRNGMAVEFAELLTRLRKNPGAYVARPLLDESSQSGLNLRLFASDVEEFSLLPLAIGRKCQPDGGASLSVGSHEEIIAIA